MTKICSVDWPVIVPVSDATLRNLIMNSKHYADYFVSFPSSIIDGQPVKFEHHRDHWRVNLFLDDFKWAIKQYIKSEKCHKLLNMHVMYLSDLSFVDTTYVVDLTIEHSVNSMMSKVLVLK